MIILFAAFLRFRDLPKMAGFDFDQESASFIVDEIIKYNHTRLIGQELTFRGIFMGPYYYYLLTPFYVLSNMHPIGGLIASVISSIAIIAAYYYVGNALFHYPAGLLAALFRSVLFEELIHDWSMVPSYFCELIVLLTWFCLWKIIHHKKQKYLYLLTFLFGLYPSFYPILFPFYFIFLFLLTFHILKVKKEVLIKSLVFLTLPMTPTIVFEVKNNFLQTRRLIELFMEPSTSSVKLISKFTKHLTYNTSELSRIINFDFLPRGLFIVMVVITLSYLIRNKVNFWQIGLHKKLLILTYAIFILSFTFLPMPVSENYFLALSTISLLYISATSSILYRYPIGRVILVFLVANIVFYNLSRLKSYSENPTLANLYHKEQIVKEIVRRSNNQEFYVSYIYLPGWQHGFRYLFYYYETIPKSGPASPPVYTIVVPKYLSHDAIDISYGNVGLILPDSKTGL